MMNFPIIPLLSELKNDKASWLSIIPSDIIGIINPYVAIETRYESEDPEDGYPIRWIVARYLRGTSILWGRSIYFKEFRDISGFKKHVITEYAGGFDAEFTDYENNILHGWHLLFDGPRHCYITQFVNGEISKTYSLHSSAKEWQYALKEGISPKYNWDF